MRFDRLGNPSMDKLTVIVSALRTWLGVKLDSDSLNRNAEDGHRFAAIADGLVHPGRRRPDAG
jgi:hypothetical protein